MGVKIYVGFHPIGLIKLNRSMDSLKYKSMSKGLIEHLNVDDIIFLISEIGNQFFDSINFHSFRHKWEVIVRIVKVSGITNVDLK